MSASDELRDPWGWLVAGVAGGLGWAVLAASSPIAVPVGIAIGAAVLGTKVALGSRTDGTPKRRSVSAGLPKPPAGSEQAGLLARAETAQRRIRALAQTNGDEWLVQRLSPMDDEAELIADRMAELAGRVTVADQTLQSARPDLLAQDRSRLAAEVAAETDPALRAERERTLQAVDQQVEAVTRLSRLRGTLLSRMQVAVLGVEGLAARMGELVAIGSDPVGHDRAGEVLADLTSELDTVRSGLAEAESLSREI